MNIIDLACTTVTLDWFDGRWWIRLVHFTEHVFAYAYWVACKGLDTQKQRKTCTQRMWHNEQFQERLTREESGRWEWDESGRWEQ